MDETYIKKVDVNAPGEILCKWHHKRDVFHRIQPPWESANIINKAASISDGLEEHIQIQMGPLKKMWIARYQDVIEGKQFCDLQVKGPFGYWLHKHIFHDNGDGTSTLEDNITYRPPLGFFGKILAGGMIRGKLDMMFDYRHEVTREDIVRHHKKDVDSRNILISGGTGLVGKNLASLLTSIGHNVSILSRSPSKPNHVKWDLEDRYIEKEKLVDIDTVINLAGASIAGLWTKKHKERIYRSRVAGTQFLVDALLVHAPKLKTFLSASGSGCYPLDSGETYDESGPIGESFLGKVANDWEKASDKLLEEGIRVAKFRIGVVISQQGGALQKMLTPAKLCLTGPWGNGKQHMSWISLADLTDILTFAVSDEKYSGVINTVAPESIEVNNFFKTVGKVLGRPQPFRVPAFIMKSLPNDMGKEIFLGDNRVKPKFLEEIGYEYRHADLETSLRFELGRLNN